jgi:hypothetical protein
MNGAIPPLPQYAFMAWCLVKAQGQLYLYGFCNFLWLKGVCVKRSWVGEYWSEGVFHVIQLQLYDRQHHSANHWNPTPPTHFWANSQVPSPRQFWADGSHSCCSHPSWVVQCSACWHTTGYVQTYGEVNKWLTLVYLLCYSKRFNLFSFEF